MKKPTINGLAFSKHIYCASKSNRKVVEPTLKSNSEFEKQMEGNNGDSG